MGDAIFFSEKPICNRAKHLQIHNSAESTAQQQITLKPAASGGIMINQIDFWV